MDELVARFKTLVLPSRSGHGEEHRQSDAQLQTLLQELQQREASTSMYDFKRLREMALINNVSRELLVEIYEASARKALWEGEFGEFIALGVRLLSEYHHQCDWISSAVLLLYGLSNWEDFGAFFYRLPQGDRPHFRSTIDMVAATRSGNLPRLFCLLQEDGRAIKAFPKLTNHLISVSRTNVKRNFVKAYLKDQPTPDLAINP